MADQSALEINRPLPALTDRLPDRFDDREMELGTQRGDIVGDPLERRRGRADVARLRGGGAHQIGQLAPADLGRGQPKFHLGVGRPRTRPLLRDLRLAQLFKAYGEFDGLRAADRVSAGCS